MDRKAEEIAVSYFSQHLVGIAPVYRLKGEPRSVRPIVKPYSGVLLFFEDTVSILTAGHVIVAIDKLHADDGLEVETCLLVGSLGTAGPQDHPVPFDWRSANKTDVDEDGLDFGLVRLAPQFARRLMQSGVRAIEETNWLKQHTLGRLDAYFMLGFPEELNLPRRFDPQCGVHVTPLLARVDPLEGMPSHRPTPKNPIFVARLQENLPLRSVVGMSGGPIIGLRRNSDGALVYWVVALLRSCVMSERLITGCPLPVLGKILRDAADGANAALDRRVPQEC